MRGGDNDDLWLLQVVVTVLQGFKQRRYAPAPIVDKLADDKIPRLLEAPPIRTCVAMKSSENTALFRDHCRMDPVVFDALFGLCAPRFPPKVKYLREVIGVTLDWLSFATSCRDQEATFGLAFVTVHKYRMLGLNAIVKSLASPITPPDVAPTALRHRTRTLTKRSLRFMAFMCRLLWLLWTRGASATGRDGRPPTFFSRPTGTWACTSSMSAPKAQHTTR